jgi:hypothetical protein
MKKRKIQTCFITVLLLTGICLLFTQHAVGQTNAFTFKLDAAAKTSAGVYLKDGTLIRTLWSGVTYSAGIHQAEWDGVDDDGRLAANASYVVKVLSNNVTYKWEGVIGNTSDSLSGSTVHHAVERMYAMAISGKNAYFAVGYNEQSGSTYKFNTGSPQKKAIILGKGLSVKYVTTDGKNVYWAGNDGNVVNNWMVFGTSVADDSEVNFSKGIVQATKYGRSYKSVIDLINNDRSAITGLAVQKKGNYLFVAHRDLNELHVLDKTTGMLVQALSFESPVNINTDGDDNVWVIYTKEKKRIIEKFVVGVDGKLASLQVVAAGLVYPLTAAVSPDGNTLVVADGADAQQLKAFKVNNGAFLWNYGTAGGYAIDPNVRDDKFYFTESKGPGTFIAFQPDGSFWVEDAGNLRAQHFGADKKIIDRIMYLQTSYSAFADGNDPTRVFSDYLEFKVDYNKPLAANNGSWQLVRNWGYNIQPPYDDKYNRLRGVATLGNGRTYALLEHHVSQLFNWIVVELPKTGPLRMTNAEFPMNNTQLYPDGSLRRLSTIRQGTPSVFTQKALLKFDTNNDPIWAPEVTVAQTGPAGLTDPGYHGNPVTLKSGETTSSGVMVLFDAGLTEGWHLGGVNVEGNKLLWRAAMSTTKQYRGLFPADGAFDIGNGTNNAGSTVMASGRNIFWGYHGEFWKNSEVNKWMHIYDDGLFVGQFGVAGPVVANIEALPEMAGNSFAAFIVKLASGDSYLYTNDESQHGGVHRWKINGLATIKEQTIPVNLVVGLGPKTTAANSLVTYTGFIAPLYSDKYQFHLKGINPATNCRLWIDGQLMDANKNLLQIDLEKNKRYFVRWECAGAATLKNAVQIYWKSTNQPEQIIPYDRVYNLSQPFDPSTIQLMEDLPFNSVLENGRYGWKRNPVAEDNTDRYTQLWNVHTNIKSYRKSAPDIYIDYRQKNNVAFLSRDIETKGNLSLWTLSGIINFTINCVNVGAGNVIDEKNSVYLQVLDKAQKVIARVCLNSLYYKGDVSLLVNSIPVVKLKYEDVQNLTDSWPSITIKMANGRLMAAYGNHAPVAVQPMDKSADLKSPASIKLVCSMLNKTGGYTLGLDGWKFEPKNKF